MLRKIIFFRIGYTKRIRNTEKAIRFHEKNLQKKYFNDLLIKIHEKKQIQLKKIWEFLRYLNKKRIFSILKKYFLKREKLIGFIVKRRNKIFYKCLFALEHYAQHKIKNKSRKMISLMYIFHQWKTITKMNIIKKNQKF